MCDPYGGPVPSDDPSAVDCSLCQKTWVCDSSSGPVEHPGSWWYYQDVWSTTGPTQAQVEQTCKQTWDCYGGCYGYWDNYYYGQFSSYKACTDECVDRYYCQGWSPYGGDPCYNQGPSTYGEKNCDKCQIIGHQCDPSYGKIPVYGDPAAPLPGGLMSPSDTCYETYACDSNSKCVYQSWSTTGDDLATCDSKCQTVAWRCDGYGGCVPVYGTTGTPLQPDQYATEVDCNNACLIRYDCYSWSGCQSIGYSSDPTKPSSCQEIDCTIRYNCDPNAGCQQIGYGTTGLKVCDDTVCIPSYNCNPSSGCVAVYNGTGQFSGATGKEALDACESSCMQRFECKTNGCKSTGYGTTGLNQAECLSSCDVKCVSISTPGNPCGFPAGNCTPIERFTQTVNVPSGVTLPTLVTMTGSADDVLMINGQVVEAGQTIGMNGCLVGAGNYSFVLNQSSFTVGAGDTVGFCSGYSYDICFSSPGSSSSS